MLAGVLVSPLAGCYGGLVLAEADTDGGATSGASSSEGSPSDTAAGTSTAGAASGNGSTSESTTGDPGDPDDSGDPSGTTGAGTGEGSTGEPEEAALPFGGHISWLVQQGNLTRAVATFYEVEYPNDEGFTPWADELPLGDPITQDDWHIHVDDDAPPDPDHPVETRTTLEVSPQIMVDLDGVPDTLVAEYDPGTERWTSQLQDISGYPGGGWSLEIPASGAFPAATFEDLFTMSTSGAAEFQLVTNGGGVPTQITWDAASEAHHIFVHMGVFGGPDGAVVGLCRGILVNDGSADIPPGCVGEGADIDPAMDALYTTLGHEFAEDVEYAGHRIRIEAYVTHQEHTPFPFTP